MASAKNNGNIEIHGELKNLKEHIVQITFRWEFDGKYQKDSCIVKDSKYVFKTKLSEPTAFSLQAKYMSKSGKVFYKIKNDQYEEKRFFLGPRKIKLKSTGSFTNMVCTTSQSNKAFEKYGKSIKSDSQVEYEANKIFHSSNFSIYPADSLEIKQKLEDSLSVSEDVKYFKKNTKSILGPYLLNSLYNNGYGINELKKLHDLLSNKCKLTYSAKSLSKKLNNYTPLIIGQSFEWFTLPDTSGKPINVSNIGHKLILIDFWASWCAPCRNQMKQLKHVYNDFHDKGLEVAAVSLDEKPGSWKKAIVDDKLPWVNVSDLKGWNMDLTLKFNIQAIPYNILIDNKGKIVATDISMDDLERKCDDLMPTL